MANVTYRGDAPKIAQLDTITVTGPVVTSEDWWVIINGKQITYTATAGTTTDVTAGLVALLNASTIPEFAEITWADADPDITATSDLAGRNFIIDSVGTDSAAGSIAKVNTTANSGPSDVSVGQNYSTGALPSAADTLIFENLDDVDLLYGLSALSAIALTDTFFEQSFTGNGGLPERNVDGEEYDEYRPTWFDLNTDNLYIGQGPGDGSSQLKINKGSNQTASFVYNSGSRLDNNLAPILLKGTNASNTLDVFGGLVDTAPFGGDAANYSTIKVSDGEMVISAATDVGAIQLNGGTVVMDTSSTSGAMTQMSLNDGNIQVDGNQVVTNLFMGKGSNLVWNSTGTVTDADISGVVDFSQDHRAKTWSAIQISDGCEILDPDGVLTAAITIAEGGSLSFSGSGGGF